MKAAVYRRYGSPAVVSVDKVPTPAPRDDEVLVRIHAATLGVVDTLARRGAPFYARAHFGLRRPRFAVLGSDFAGQIEAVGPAVTRLAVGDQVFGTMAPRFGAHAEYACLSEQSRAGAQTGQRDLRRGGRARRHDGTVLPPGQGGPSARADPPGQRRVRRGRHRRSSPGMLGRS